MTKRAINPFALCVGFVFLSALYYWQIVLIDKPMVYSFVFGAARAILIFSAFGYFWVLVKQVPVLKNARQKINQYPSANNLGGVVIALTLGIIHMALVSFGTIKFNNYLLSTSGKLANAVIKDCRQNKRGEYCLYQYAVNDKFYQVQIFNRPKKYKEQDTIAVLYYPKLPVISIIKE
ncbi:hypothetical protein [Lacibacter sp.]|uniref:hypothetical protein n=1 Tax=Lacibacter sp. TaxID=1915409 RepID=UPI002B4AB1ED|nr:hypothetical protein [Lacibacter sp.]HLP37482.1 hypothetical protein [Lacibacter sp.]